MDYLHGIRYLSSRSRFLHRRIFHPPGFFIGDFPYIWIDGPGLQMGSWIILVVFHGSLARSTFARRRASGKHTTGGELDQFHLSLPKFHGCFYHLLFLLRFAFELAAMDAPLQRPKLGKNRNLSNIMVNISSEASHRARFRCKAAAN